MSDLQSAMSAACDSVGIKVPLKVTPGVWAKSPVVGKSAGNRSGRVLVFEDYRGGIAHNWATGCSARFSVDEQGLKNVSSCDRAELQRKRKEREARENAEAQEAQKTCQIILQACRQEGHAYLERKGFPDATGLVVDHPGRYVSASDFGARIARAMPETDKPLLVVPGRVGKVVTTLQFITETGEKKNIFGGKMAGASHRIASGRETWIAEGIATAMTIRAALALLGRSATVLTAFSAGNVFKVASAIPGAIIAADHDKPVEQFGGLGTGEYWARKSGCVWTMPPELGDFNDFHSEQGLRAVALHLRGVGR